MRLVVMGGYSLDVLQRQVVTRFSQVPSLPREPSPFPPNHVHPNSWEETYQSQMADTGLPFHSSIFGKIFRTVPVQDRHTLSITWQLPSQIPNWRTKPCDYIAHLLGHEAQGSLLSSLKKKSWATACFAGVGSEGLESASSHALFTLTFSLSKEGVQHWREIVTQVYRYIGMLRYYASNELPGWIHQELKSIHELSYRYADEPSADDFVQDLAGELAPHNNLPPERLLDGSELLFDYDPDEIKVCD
jgi:nardilysin